MQRDSTLLCTSSIRAYNPPSRQQERVSDQQDTFPLFSCSRGKRKAGAQKGLIHSLWGEGFGVVARRATNPLLTHDTGEKSMGSKIQRQCKLMIVQNGQKPFVRNVAELEVQAADGKIYTLKGAALPQVMVVYMSGKSEAGSSAQILLRPHDSSLWSYTAPRSNDFPRFRDIVMMAIGVMSFHFAFALIDGLANAF